MLGLVLILLGLSWRMIVHALVTPAIHLLNQSTMPTVTTPPLWGDYQKSKLRVWKEKVNKKGGENGCYLW